MIRNRLWTALTVLLFSLSFLYTAYAEQEILVLPNDKPDAFWSEPNVQANADNYTIEATYTETRKADWMEWDGVPFLVGEVALSFQGSKLVSISKKLTPADWVTEELTGTENKYPVLSGTVKVTLPADCEQGTYELIWQEYIPPERDGPCYRIVSRTFLIGEESNNSSGGITIEDLGGGTAEPPEAQPTESEPEPSPAPPVRSVTLSFVPLDMDSVKVVWGEEVQGRLTVYPFSGSKPVVRIYEEYEKTENCRWNEAIEEVSGSTFDIRGLARGAEYRFELTDQNGVVIGTGTYYFPTDEIAKYCRLHRDYLGILSGRMLNERAFETSYMALDEAGSVSAETLESNILAMIHRGQNYNTEYSLEFYIHYRAQMRSTNVYRYQLVMRTPSGDLYINTFDHPAYTEYKKDTTYRHSFVLDNLLISYYERNGGSMERGNYTFWALRDSYGVTKDNELTVY